MVTKNIQSVDTALDQKQGVGRRQFNKLLASMGIATATIPFIGSQPVLAAGNDLHVFTFDIYEAPELHQEIL